MSEKTYICIDCEKKYKNPYALQKHYLKKHKRIFLINEVILLSDIYYESEGQIFKFPAN